MRSGLRCLSVCLCLHLPFSMPNSFLANRGFVGLFVVFKFFFSFLFFFSLSLLFPFGFSILGLAMKPRLASHFYLLRTGTATMRH